MSEKYIKIVVTDRGHEVVYRFYGLGVWRVRVGDEWRYTNAAYVPAEALKIAARECEPTPQR